MDRSRTATSLISRFGAHLAACGLLATRQREVILRDFSQCDSFISIDDLLAQTRESLPHIGFVTVYRTLKMFVQAGIARERLFDDGKLRFMPLPTTKHHPTAYMLCVQCGNIVAFTDRSIASALSSVARRLNYELVAAPLELRGICVGCRRDGAIEVRGTAP